MAATPSTRPRESLRASIASTRCHVATTPSPWDRVDAASPRRRRRGIASMLRRLDAVDAICKRPRRFRQAVTAPIDRAQVCDFTDAEKEKAQREIDEDKKKRLEMQADMGKFLLLLGFGMLYYFWVSYDVVPPIIDRAAQLLGFARFARVGDLKAMFSGGQEL